MKQGTTHAARSTTVYLLVSAAYLLLVSAAAQCTPEDVGKFTTNLTVPAPHVCAYNLSLSFGAECTAVVNETVMLPSMSKGAMARLIGVLSQAQELEDVAVLQDTTKVKALTVHMRNGSVFLEFETNDAKKNTTFSINYAIKNGTGNATGDASFNTNITLDALPLQWRSTLGADDYRQLPMRQFELSADAPSGVNLRIAGEKLVAPVVTKTWDEKTFASGVKFSVLRDGPDECETTPEDAAAWPTWWIAILVGGILLIIGLIIGLVYVRMKMRGLKRVPLPDSPGT